MNTTKIICECCEQEVEKPTSEVNRSREIGRPLYCSISCGATLSHKRRREKSINDYNTNPKLCIYCGSPISYEFRNENKYCSKSCAAKVNNVVRDRAKEKKYCLSCNAIIPKKQKYCSRKCQSIAQKKNTTEKIERGEKVCDQQLKKYIIKIRGEKCEICGWKEINQKSGKCPVQMEHVDGNSENSSLENLKLLCPNCHSLTPTFGALNKGRGRKLRYKK